MRVLVAGATGYLGQGLCRALLARGDMVIALTRNPARARARLDPRIEALAWDGRTTQGWGARVAGVEAIVNLVGENIGARRWTAARKKAIIESRTRAGQALAEAVQAASSKPRVFLQQSAVGYYGSRGDKVLDESAPPGEGFLSEVVQAWEASTATVEALGVRRVVTRSAIVLRADQDVLPRMMLPFRFFVGGPLSSGRQWFSWIHYADEIGAFLFLLDRPTARGLFNLAAPEPLPESEFARLLGQAMRRPSWIPVPALVLRLLFGQMAEETLLTSQRVVPRRLLEHGYGFQYPMAAAALRHLIGTKGT